MNSWKCEVHAEGEWVSNGLRFATEQEALNYGTDLLSRWFLPDDHRAVQSEDQPNYRWNGSSLEEITNDTKTD